MQFGLLGPLEVRGDDGSALDLRGAQPRLVLAVLLAAEGRVVPVDVLVDALWGEDPPGSATGTLQTLVSRLRRALEPGRGPRDPARVLLSEPPGYRLAVEADAVDFRRFERLADEGRAALDAGRFEVAVTALTEAEALWRGPALAEHPEAEAVRGLATRLEERRRVVLEQRLEAELALGRHGPVAAAAAEAVRTDPLRERRWELLALALYRSGRQAEALRALGEVRRTLVEELGVEPGRALKDLEAAILAQDPALDPVGGARAPAAPAPPVVAPPPQLVGRVAELGALRAALEEASSGARFAVVTGEPGIGKTALLEALAAEARARGAVVAWGRAYESGEAPAFWPWLEVLRGLGLGELLAPATAGPSAPGASFRVFEGVATALGEVARERPTVLLFDDLQWADPDSLSLLTFLAGRLQEEHVLVVATSREGEAVGNDDLVALLAALARRPASRRLSLHGLTQDQVAALLEARVGRDLPSTVSAAITERSEGNPFFARELAQLVADDGSVADAVPATVGDVVRQRLGRLPPRTVELLGVAAVLGRDVEPDVLAGAADRALDQVLEGLEPAFEAAVLAEGELGALRFSHALVRESLVDQLGGVRRTRLHLRAADAIVARHGDRDEVAEVVAEHLWAAAPLGVGARAAEALERAGMVAFRRAALASAGRSFERAVSLHLAGGAQEAELRALVRLLDVRRLLGDYAGVARAYERATERARELGRDDVLIELLWAEWGVHSIMGSFARSRELAEELVAVAGASGDPVLRFAGHTMAGLQAWDEGRITRMRTELEAAEALCGSLPAGADRTSVVGYQLLLQQTFLAHVAGLTGDLGAAEARFAALGDPAADAYQRITAAVFRGTTLLATGHLDELEAVTRAGLEADPEGLYVLWSANLRMQHGIALVHAGDLEAGRTSFEAGRSTYARLGLRAGLTAMLASVGAAALRHGLVAEAEQRIGEARAEFDATGQGWTEPLLLLAEAELAAAAGAPAGEVADLLARAEALARDQGATAVAARIAAVGASP